VQSGSLLIDSSTVDPATSQEMETEAASKGAVYMDSPVSGGTVSCIVMCICLTSLLASVPSCNTALPPVVIYHSSADPELFCSYCR